MTPFEKDNREYWIAELYFWQHSYTGCFNNMLFDMIHKADKNNLQRLKMGYANAVLTYQEWCSFESSEAFFEKYKS